MILGVIESSQKGAFEVTVYHAIDAVELAYVKTESSGMKSYNFADNVDELQLKGEKPAGG